MQTVLRYFRIAIYPLVVCFIVAQAPKTALAQGEHEHVSVTTYYPSPKGNFNELAVGTSLDFHHHSAISIAGRGDVVHFGNFEYYEDKDRDGVEERYTHVAIGFNVPVKFEQGVTFDTNSSVIFDNNKAKTLTLTVNNVIVDTALIATSYQCPSPPGTYLYEYGDGSIAYPHTLIAPTITADTYIESGPYGPPSPGHLSAPHVIDTSRGLDLGASLVNRLAADNFIFGKLVTMQQTMTASFAVAAGVCSFYDWGAALAFAIFAGGSTLVNILSWLDYYDIEPPSFLQWVWNNLYEEPVLLNAPYALYVPVGCI